MDTEKKVVSLDGLIADSAKADLVREFEFLEGFKLRLKFMSRTLAQTYVDQCRVRKFNPQTRQREDTLDAEKLQGLMVKNHFIGWTGFTIKHLREIVVVNKTDLDDDTEIEFTSETALQLVQQSTDMEEFVFETIRNVAAFQRDSLEDELGN